MKQYTDLRNTFKRYISGQLNPAETGEFLAHIQSGEDKEFLKKLIQETLGDSVEADQLNDLGLVSILDESWTNLQGRIGQPPEKKVINGKRAISIAATLLCILSGSLWLYLTKQSSEPYIVSTQETIVPGLQTATLTLADGRKIRLAESDNGELAKDGGVIISKNADGQLLYEVQEGTDTSSGYNTLSTAKGETYRVRLPDGTQVWLNAASSIRYAASFSTHATRDVELEGEAYFEVTRDAERPFVVRTRKQQVSVLGTKFNIYAYTEEAEQYTTLVQGAVRVETGQSSKSVQLKPGQQAISKGNNELLVLQVDPTEYISWKDGIILLNSYDLQEILRQLERWYDVRFDEIPQGIQSDRVFGMIQRDVPLKDVLKTLADNYSGIKFNINGRRVMISGE